MNDDPPSFAVQRERRLLLQQFVDALTFNARSPKRIWKRLMYYDHALQKWADTAEKQKELAARIDVSETRVSIGVKQASQNIDLLIKS